MRLRTATRRAGIAALATGLAAVGVLALPAPASAAGDITTTLRITISHGNSVFVNVRDFRCYRNFVIGVTKDVVVTAPKGYRIQVYPSDSCYNSISPILGIPIDQDGQVIELQL